MIELLTTIDSIVWGPAMIALLLGTHIYLTFRTGFIQRKLPQAIRMSVRRDPSGKGAVSYTHLDVYKRQVLFAPYELPVGILLAFIGGPFFIYLILKNKGGGLD